jgi:Helix-turn-helix of DDE superfamily endonuclease
MTCIDPPAPSSHREDQVARQFTARVSLAVSPSRDRSARILGTGSRGHTRLMRVIGRLSGRLGTWWAPAPTRVTISVARSRSFILRLFDARVSVANAWSASQRDSVMMMPIACRSPTATARPVKTLTFVAGIIRRHQVSIGSLSRKLNPGQQALLVLAYLRKGETFAELAGEFGIGTMPMSPLLKAYIYTILSG